MSFGKDGQPTWRFPGVGQLLVRRVLEPAHPSTCLRAEGSISLPKTEAFLLPGSTSPSSPGNWCPFTVSFLGGGEPPTKIDYRKKGTLILTSLLEDLVGIGKFVSESERIFGDVSWLDM